MRYSFAVRGDRCHNEASPQLKDDHLTYQSMSISFSFIPDGTAKMNKKMENRRSTPKAHNDLLATYRPRILTSVAASAWPAVSLASSHTASGATSHTALRRGVIRAGGLWKTERGRKSHINLYLQGSKPVSQAGKRRNQTTPAITGFCFPTTPDRRLQFFRQQYGLKR